VIFAVGGQIYLSGPKSGPDKWSNQLVSLQLFIKLGENGAPGMRHIYIPV
jgi:hypothetical protein